MVDDLISRQAAIDALTRLSNDPWNQETTASWAAGFSEAACIIEDLPSAQPEIIRCKDCYYCVAEKSFGKMYYYCDAFSYHAEGDLIGVSLQVSPEHFCGWAERRTDE